MIADISRVYDLGSREQPQLTEAQNFYRLFATSDEKVHNMMAPMWLYCKWWHVLWHWNRSTTSWINATTISSNSLLISSHRSIRCWKTYTSLERFWPVLAWIIRILMCAKRIACCSGRSTRMTPNICIAIGQICEGSKWRWSLSYHKSGNHNVVTCLLCQDSNGCSNPKEQ
jgi:hypothetical protein